MAAAEEQTLPPEDTGTDTGNEERIFSKTLQRIACGFYLFILF